MIQIKNINRFIIRMYLVSAHRMIKRFSFYRRSGKIAERLQHVIYIKKLTGGCEKDTLVKEGFCNIYGKSC